VGYDTNSLSLLGGGIAALVAGRLLLNRYPNTWTIVLRCVAFWCYVGYYGLLGFVMTWVIFRTPWGRLPYIYNFPSAVFWPVAVGLVGPFAKMTLVGSMPGADHFHFTIRAALVLFEPGLLNAIRNEEYVEVKDFVRSYVVRWSDLTAVLSVIDKNLPDNLEEGERALFLHRLFKKTTPEEALIAYLRFLGKRNFTSAFDTPPATLQVSGQVTPTAVEPRAAIIPRKPARSVSRETLPDAMPRKPPIETQQVG
jgi:hypothetical protein